MTDDAAAVPYGPSAEERAARDRVRSEATGMTHHQSAAALEAAERAALKAAGDLEDADGRTRAAVAEWRRITDLLFDRGGPYSPDGDAFAQGQLTARQYRRTAAEAG
ncbi:hypothetical protein [Streptomyces sp. NPDC051567]|uniref:hypothetical protein n=1 Tax=Streptomyces sp. NPDC051567 TaxID=3365660 RepID=UPI0037B3D877